MWRIGSDEILNEEEEINDISTMYENHASIVRIQVHGNIVSMTIIQYYSIHVSGKIYENDVEYIVSWCLCVLNDKELLY